MRTRIFGLSYALLIVNVIHPEAILENMLYVVRNDRLVETDGAKFTLSVKESSATR